MGSIVVPTVYCSRRGLSGRQLVDTREIQRQVGGAGPVSEKLSANRGDKRGPIGSVVGLASLAGPPILALMQCIQKPGELRNVSLRFTA